MGEKEFERKHKAERIQETDREGERETEKRTNSFTETKCLKMKLKKLINIKKTEQKQNKKQTGKKR